MVTFTGHITTPGQLDCVGETCENPYKTSITVPRGCQVAMKHMLQVPCLSVEQIPSLFTWTIVLDKPGFFSQ